MELEPRPETIHIDAQDQLLPRGPLTFWKEAVPGGFGGWGVQLVLAWVAFEALTSASWAIHLRKAADFSALPSYWGELLTVRDIWEIAVNGGLKDHPIGLWTPVFGILALIWVFWAGWRLQAKAIDVPARFRTWFWGFIDALLIGLPPLFILDFLLSQTLEGMASTGIPLLGWMDFVGAPLIKFTCLSVFSLQWWFCRLDRASHDSSAWHLGGLASLGRHLGHSFLRVWMHPVQWLILTLGGVLLRLGLHFLVLALAWYLGGGSPGRVWLFLLLELLATALCAWQLGWFLRLTALFYRLDLRIRLEVQSLEHLVEGE